MTNLDDRRFTQVEDPFVMEDLRQMENAPNYSEWLYSRLKPYLGKRVLEIGPGTGSISRKLIDDVDLLVGIEPNKYCFDILENSLSKNPNFLLFNKKVEDYETKGLESYHFDSVLCVNVLEHIENDIKTLDFFESILVPNGRVVLLVPAVQRAYGPIDKAVGHFRRYNKAGMAETISHTSLVIEKQFYMNFFGLLGWMFNAKIAKSQKQSVSQIKLFNSLVPMLSFIERHLGCPVGLSLISISRKKQ